VWVHGFHTLRLGSGLLVVPNILRVPLISRLANNDLYDSYAHVVEHYSQNNNGVQNTISKIQTQSILPPVLLQPVRQTEPNSTPGQHAHG